MSRGCEVAELAVDCRCLLGEGILWSAQHATLLWTDIQGARLWMHHPAQQRTHSWSLPDRLGSLALCNSEHLLLGLAKGLYLAPFDVGADALAPLTLLTPVEAQEPRTRINDGRCDRAGNFVFGTLNQAPSHEPIGSFYQYSARHGLRRLDLGGVATPNSICFSIDGGTLYYCDSRQQRILCCDYDADSAAVANSRVFAAVTDGSPDGSTIDAEGCLWNAQWGAARVVRYTPHGAIERTLHLPARNPSCVAFGGERLDQLFITTAREDLSVDDLQHMPDAGGVYHWHAPGLRGLPESRMCL